MDLFSFHIIFWISQRKKKILTHEKVHQCRRIISKNKKGSTCDELNPIFAGIRITNPSVNAHNKLNEKLLPSATEVHLL